MKSIEVKAGYMGFKERLDVALKCKSFEWRNVVNGERREVVDVHAGQMSRGCLVLKLSEFSAITGAGNCDSRERMGAIRDGSSIHQAPAPHLHYNYYLTQYRQELQMMG
jgi:hypothetical protein